MTGSGGPAVVEAASPRAGAASPARRKPGATERQTAGLWSCALAFGAMLFLLLWGRTLHSVYLAAGAASVAGSFLLARRTRFRSRSVPLYGALGALALALAAGAATAHRLGRLAAEWDRLVAEREAPLAAELDQHIRALVDRGQRAARAAAARAARADGARLFADLAEVRLRWGVDALAIHDAAGELRAWAGDHRGRLPREAFAGQAGIVYVERPLFSYLYFSSPVEGREEHAVAAVLLQTGLPLTEVQVTGFADAFEARTGSRPVFGPGPDPSAPWNLALDGDTILHAHFEPLSQVEWRAAIVTMGRRAVAILAAVAFVLLAYIWISNQPRARRAASMAPLVAATLALALAPVGDILGLDRVFSPALFVLPIPGDVSLGLLLTVLLPLGALAATHRPRPRDARGTRRAVAIGALAVALGSAVALRILTASAAPQLLEGGSALWGALQPAAVLIITILAGLVLPRERSSANEGSTRRLLLAGGLALSILLAIGVTAQWELARALGPWMSILWAGPYTLLALGLARERARTARLLRWLSATWLAASLVVPYLWVVNVEARLRAAERDLATLGMRADPFLEYLLHNFAREVMRRHERGEDGMELLYRAWVASGLAREAYPARLSLLDATGRPTYELTVGDRAGESPRLQPMPRFLRGIFDRAREQGEPLIEAPQVSAGVNRVLAVPFADGRMVTAIIPPRRSIERTTILASLLGGAAGADTRLTLLPAKAGQPRPEERVRWRPSEQGWSSEAVIRYPDGDYHAHLELRLPPAGVRVARGILFLALDLALATLLWVVGRAARGFPPVPPGRWSGWLKSFRAQVTLALFAFFLLPTVAFGTLAYRALASERARAARIIAEDAVAQAVRDFGRSEGDLAALAEHTGAEILYYHRGELAKASSPEAFELGLYSAWMPPSVFLALQSGEATAAVETWTLGRHPFLLAFRPLPAAGTLAVPVSLAVGDGAIRQRELAHLMLFAVLMGGVLSLALSVAVGRALSRPIGQLRRAAAVVGAGRLNVRLPENRRDEFGQLFASFNRMVRRLRRARAQELHTARVLAWGEMARQVAHEIKNPLTPIKLSVQHLRRAYADRRPEFGEILETSVDQILTEIDRLTEIARAFSRYGAPPEAAGALEAVDVGAVIHEALTLYRTGDTAIRYLEEVEPGLPPARARAGELKEVILNLLENARAAVQEGGTIRVSATRVGGTIELALEDDGEGIPPELLSRIFDPHFSTRSAGTGLGLAIVRRLVESWGGVIIADSEPGRGTTMRVRIPIATET